MDVPSALRSATMAIAGAYWTLLMPLVPFLLVMLAVVLAAVALDARAVVRTRVSLPDGGPPAPAARQRSPVQPLRASASGSAATLSAPVAAAELPSFAPPAGQEPPEPPGRQMSPGTGTGAPLAVALTRDDLRAIVRLRQQGVSADGISRLLVLRRMYSVRRQAVQARPPSPAAPPRDTPAAR